MKCAFCQATNDPKAKFCGNCGSPLNLQLCPACEAVNEHTANACVQCGGSLSNAKANGNATEAAANLVAKNSETPPDNTANPEEWKTLLQTLEAEVERELNLWKEFTTEKKQEESIHLDWQAESTMHYSVAQRTPMRSAATIEVTQPRWYQSSLLWIALIGWAATIYFLYPSSSASTTSTQETPAAKPSTGLSTPRPAPQQPPRSNLPAIIFPDPEQNTTTLKMGNRAVPTAYAYNQNPLLNASPLPMQRDTDQQEHDEEKTSAPHPTPTAPPSWKASKTAPNTPRPAQVIINVSPWGKIYIDGKKRGVSPPVTKFALAPGKHSIEIRNSNLPPYQRRIELDAGEAIRIKHKFSGK